MIITYEFEQTFLEEEIKWIQANIPASMTPCHPFLRFSPINGIFRAVVVVRVDVGDDTELATLITISKKCRVE